jgi:hypothetical protein
MSDLQIALVILGALVIGCVIAYNRVQEGRFRKRAEASLGGDRGDALLEPVVRGRPGRIEPHIEPHMQRGAAEPDGAAPGRVEPIGVPSRPTAEGDETSPIDYGIEVNSEQPLQRPALQQLLDALDGLGRQAHVTANLADGIWASLASATAPVSRMRVALQLADRRGHVTEDDLRAFQGLVSQWAEGVGAAIKFPEPGPCIEVAKELDRFCADVDVLVGLNVVAATGEPFSGTKVRSCAEANGFRLENGIFRFEDVHGARLFSLENQQGDAFEPDRLATSTIDGVTVLLDVPCLDQGVKVFDQMLDTGRQLANCLGGTLVDDNRTPVTEAGLEQIRNQLRHIYAAMEVRGIRAGSHIALRLFS